MANENYEKEKLKMLNDKLRQFLNLIFALAQPVVALLVNLEITGPSVGAISDRYPTYVVPAGYAFSIWSLLFALGVGYGIWQALPAQRTNPLLRRIGWPTAAALFATSAWMLTFQRSLFGLSLMIMLGLLLALILVVARLYQAGASTSSAEQWLVYSNFSIFLGWITVATTANISQTLTAFRWDGWGLEKEIWAILALLITGAAAAFVTLATRGNVPYTLTVIWGLIGVAVNQFTRAVPTNSARVGTTVVALSLLILLLLFVSRRNRRALDSDSQHAKKTIAREEKSYARS